MNQELVSVIIPIYNAEKFLDKCISSVTNQSYNNLEILLINDGSSDRCGEICDEWAKKDSKIKYTKQENAGVTKARAKGVSLAMGQWIYFVDSDDVLPDHSIEILINKLKDNDIVIGQVEFDGTYKWPFKKFNNVLSTNKYISKILTEKIHGGPVARLINVNLFNDFIFDIPRRITCGEDFLMNLRVARNAKKIRIIDDIVYKYIFRDTSAVSENRFNSIQYSIMFEKLVLTSLIGYKKKLIIPLLIHYKNRLFSFFNRNIKQLIIHLKNKLFITNKKHVFK
jgi:glycosyltransferase involved in cell wall biosynthesis